MIPGEYMGAKIGRDHDSSFEITHWIILVSKSGSLFVMHH
jgi:hypothetical protein